MGEEALDIPPAVSNADYAEVLAGQRIFGLPLFARIWICGKERVAHSAIQVWIIRVSRTKVMVEISESYRGSGHYKWMRPTVDRLLQSLPPELLTGLETIVLTDAQSIGPGKTQRVRGRKHHRNKCLGFYHHRTQSEVAFIELIADNIAPRGAAPTSASAVLP